MEEKKFEEKLAEFLKEQPIESFNSSVISLEAIDQMISAHQLKYLENLIQTEEENKLAKENMHDFLQYPRDIQETAVKHADGAKYDPDYFTKNKIDKELIKPIQILNVIDIKKEEAKTKNWKVLYHARLVERLRYFRGFCKENKSFFSLIFSK